MQQVSLFARHFSKSPELLGPEEIRSYQVYLTNEKKHSPSYILIAVSALRFLYKVTLHRDWCLEDIIPAPKKPLRPVPSAPKRITALSPYPRLFLSPSWNARTTQAVSK
ncbi:MAG: phage integrase N-terminal SAM-like domain-containing protein [Verrucomicrobia bacterium]|nr:phage integrase N-terminal SAM-like domain-containing protein [Verrucomicrobiota bacterium]